MIHLLGHVQKLVQVHTSVGELPEGTLLLDLGIRLGEMSSTQVSMVIVARHYIDKQLQLNKVTKRIHGNMYFAKLHHRPLMFIVTYWESTTDLA